MPRKIYPKPCSCGCGGMTGGGEWLPGHDSKTMSAIVAKVGGTLELKKLVEKTLHCRIKVKVD